MAFVVGVGLASLSWQSLLAGVGALGNRHLSPRFQALTSIVGNLIVIGLGARILSEGLGQGPFFFCSERCYTTPSCDEQ